MNDTPFFLALGTGMETDIAEQLVQPGSVPLLENMAWNERGQLTRRVGCPVLSTSSTATLPVLPVPTTLPDTWRMGTLRGDLVRFNAARASAPPVPLLAWSPSAGKYVRPTPPPDVGYTVSGSTTGGLLSSNRIGPTSVDTLPVYSSTPGDEAVGMPSVAVSGNFAMVCYEHANAAHSWTEHRIIDLSTRTVVLRRMTESGTFRPRPIMAGGRCIVAYASGGDIQVDAYDMTTLALVQQQTMGPCDADSVIDVRAGSVENRGAHDVSILFTKDSGGGPEIRCAVVDSANLASNDEFFVVAPGLGHATLADLALGWLQDLKSAGKFSVIAANTTDGLMVIWNLPAPTAGASTGAARHDLDPAATAAPSGGTPGIRNVVGSTVGINAAGQYVVLYEETAPSVPTRAVIKSATYLLGSITLATPGLATGIRSQLWANGSSFYLWTAWAGPDQETYFVQALTNDGTASVNFAAPQAVSFVRSAGGLTERVSHPSQIATGPNGELIAAVTNVTRSESTASAGVATGADGAVKAINLVSLSHRAAGDTAMSAPVEHVGHLFTPGGLLGSFDGTTYGLPGFAYYPPSMGASSATGGNLTTNGAYRWRYCYAFLDRNGRKWRSAPSTPTSLTLSGTDKKVNLTLETLRVLDRGDISGGVGDYQIEVYRTQANETDAYFLVASIANVPGASTVSLQDNVADVNLGEELYTDGGGLENQLLPPVSHVALFQRRLFAVEQGTGTLWYSLEADLNHGLIFNEAMTLDVGDPAEPITGIAGTDSYLAVLKGARVYVVSGIGADALGNGATYADRLVETGIGCSESTSVIAAPDNTVWFKSSSERAGFHRVNGLAVEYVGQGVRAYNDLPVTAAVVVGDRAEMRWYTSNGRTLVRNWLTGTWRTDTGQPCWAATAYGRGAVYANSSTGSLLQDGTSGVDFTDGGTAFSGRVRSPWLSVGDMEGWERVKRIQGVGVNPVAHKLTVNLYRDFDDTDRIGSLTKTFDGTGTKWTWEIRPRVQQLSALMIEVIVETTTPATVGPSISGVTLMVAVQKGLRRTSPRNRLSPA